MRVVIDTNVIISGIFWTGKPTQILNLARIGKLTFLTSRYLLQELYRILVSENKPFHLNKDDANLIKNHIKGFAEVIKTKTKVSVCVDDADNRVLECAIEGRADYIITGDKDLLKLSSFKGIKIRSVAEFLKSFS